MTRSLLTLIVAVCPAFALEPGDVIVVVNKNVPASSGVADHYVKARGVPAGNVIVLDLPKEEDISRKDYDDKLVAPLRKSIGDRKDKVKCLLCCYGVPLRVGGASPTETERDELKTLAPQFKEAEEAVKTAEAQIKNLEGQSGPLGVLRRCEDPGRRNWKRVGRREMGSVVAGRICRMLKARRLLTAS